MNSINYGKCNYCEKYFARKLRFHMVPESTNQTKKTITVYVSLCSTEEVYNAVFYRNYYQERLSRISTVNVHICFKCNKFLEEISYLNDIS